MRNKVAVKLLLSVILIALAFAAVATAYSPMFVTYVPLEQAYGISKEHADLTRRIIEGRRERQQEALEVSSIIVLIMLIFSLFTVWYTKTNEK